MIKVYKHNFKIDFSVVPDIFYGVVMRGGIGSYLRNYLSSKEYEKVFNTPSDGIIMKKYPEVPKGYVVETPYRNEKSIKFSLILFDKTERYFEAFLKAILKTAERNKIEIAYNGMETVDRRTFSTSSIEIALTYETPACIRHKGKLWQKPELHILTRSILRRGFLLGHYYSDIQPEIDKSVIDIAERVQISNHDCIAVGISRYSTRTEKKMPMRGLVGTASYSLPSDLSPDDKGKLFEVLKAGEAFHVGKNTVFGFGKIIVVS